jgi:hypothetical protein
MTRAETSEVLTTLRETNRRLHTIEATLTLLVSELQRHGLRISDLEQRRISEVPAVLASAG